jgi:uncharacterized protein (TIGR02217 family)
MAITVFNDVVLPESLISSGIVGKNQHNNTRAISASGYATVNINWTKSLRQYQLGVLPLKIDQWQTLEGLHQITYGGAYGFLMQDPKDQAVSASEGFLVGSDGYGVGTGLATYQLHKKYLGLDSTRAFYRKITRPKNPIIVSKNSNTVTQGTSPGNCAVNYDTGEVTFVADVTQSIVSITLGSTTVLEFANDTLVNSFAVGGQVWIEGVTGPGAGLINDKAHEVLAKDIINFTLEIDLDTSDLLLDSLTAFLNDGTAKKFPQPTDTLRWVGQFYVPVHFANDEIDWEVFISGSYSGRHITAQNVILQEIRE